MTDLSDEYVQKIRSAQQAHAESLSPIDRMLEDAQAYLSAARGHVDLVADRDISMARALAAVAAGLQVQQQLILARESRRIQEQQLELQRQVGLPGLMGCVELVSRIAATDHGSWTADMVSEWIIEARKLDTP